MVVSSFLCPSSALIRRMSFVWSYFCVAKWCRRFRMGILVSSGWLRFRATFFLVLLHSSPIAWEFGKGLLSVYLWRYILSMSAVLAFSLIVREL